MTFFGFYWQAVHRSFHSAWHAGHTAHAIIIIGTGGLILLGWHFGEHELIVVPFLVLLGAFLFGVLWFAYVIYRDEHSARGKSEAAVRELKTPKVIFTGDACESVLDHHFRVTVKNVSGATVERVGVLLIRMEPSVKLILPIPLHCTHNDPRPQSGLINLDPETDRTFDVLRFGNHGPGKLDVAGTTWGPDISTQKYRLTLQVHGNNIPSADHDFIFEPKPDGTFAFHAADSGQVATSSR